MILMVGVPGSGKSTQSQLLAATGNYRWVYIGEVLRRTVSGEDAALMRSGKLLDDNKVISYLEQEIARIGEGPEIIIDGFPRSVFQTEWLIGSHASQAYAIRAVVHIQVEKEVVLERLVNRGRPDDTEEAIAARFKIYDTAIHPIIADLQSHNVPIVTVDGSKEALDVFADISKELARL